MNDVELKEKPPYLIIPKGRKGLSHYRQHVGCSAMGAVKSLSEFLSQVVPQDPEALENMSDTERGVISNVVSRLSPMALNIPMYCDSATKTEKILDLNATPEMAEAHTRVVDLLAEVEKLEAAYQERVSKLETALQAREEVVWKNVPEEMRESEGMTLLAIHGTENELYKVTIDCDNCSAKADVEEVVKCISARKPN
jgi:hypothetical protein